MALRRVVFVDTSIILRLIGNDGDDLAREAAVEFDSRRSRGQQLVLPVTALIEAGNRVTQQQASKRRRLADQLGKLIEAANKPDAPWILRETALDQQFVDDLLAGNATGSDMVTLLGDGRLGVGGVWGGGGGGGGRRKPSLWSVEWDVTGAVGPLRSALSNLA